MFISSWYARGEKIYNKTQLPPPPPLIRPSRWEKKEKKAGKEKKKRKTQIFNQYFTHCIFLVYFSARHNELFFLTLKIFYLAFSISGKRRKKLPRLNTKIRNNNKKRAREDRKKKHWWESTFEFLLLFPAFFSRGSQITLSPSEIR